MLIWRCIAANIARVNSGRTTIRGIARKSVRPRRRGSISSASSAGRSVGAAPRHVSGNSAVESAGQHTRPITNTSKHAISVVCSSSEIMAAIVVIKCTAVMRVRRLQVAAVRSMTASAKYAGVSGEPTQARSRQCVDGSVRSGVSLAIALNGGLQFAGLLAISRHGVKRINYRSGLGHAKQECAA